MQVQAINTYNNQPEFGAIKIQDGLQNNKFRKTITNYIIRKLNEIDPSDRLNRSYVERAERWDHDILFTIGKKNNSVRVDVIPKHSQGNVVYYLPMSNNTHIGTYSRPEQFDIQHFNNVYKATEKIAKIYDRVMTGLLGVLGTTVIITFGYAIKKDLTFVEKKTSTTIVGKNSLKTDSIKPVLEDSFKLGKNFIKK